MFFLGVLSRTRILCILQACDYVLHPLWLLGVYTDEFYGFSWINLGFFLRSTKDWTPDKNLLHGNGRNSFPIAMNPYRSQVLGLYFSDYFALLKKREKKKKEWRDIAKFPFQNVFPFFFYCFWVKSVNVYLLPQPNWLVRCMKLFDILTLDVFYSTSHIF